MVFTADVYERIRAGAISSAEVVVPLVLDYLAPKSGLRVADVGCGQGWWAREFARHGCSVIGYDETVPDTGLRFDGGEFVRAGLPGDLHRVLPGFDLAVCLEVAEHLPERDAAGLVAGLVRLAPVVVFSAAIPGQGGHGHLNEQDAGYWADLFAGHRYLPVDCLRREIWTDDRIEVWYRQNLLFYAAEGHPLLRHPQVGPSDLVRPLQLVHPGIYEWRLAEIRDLRAEVAELRQRLLDLL